MSAAVEPHLLANQGLLLLLPQLLLSAPPLQALRALRRDTRSLSRKFTCPTHSIPHMSSSFLCGSRPYLHTPCARLEGKYLLLREFQQFELCALTPSTPRSLNCMQAPSVPREEISY